ncbi:MAG: efflux RND transporter permease subunit [Calditrichaeota bacterium]|nr:efflux RND transporter permease subunit [Calditrichota bacterium]
MKLADISIRRPILMTMVIGAFVVMGLFSLTRLGIDIFPDVEFPFVVATLIYPGAGPEEMERLVAEPVEEEISSIGGLKHVTSISQEGLTLVLCEFDLKMSVDLAALDVRDKIDLIRWKLPRDLQDPVIQKWDFASMPIIDLAVTSPRALEETFEIAEDDVKHGLTRIRGVAGINLTGGKEREIQVHLSRRQLREYNLAPEAVTAFIGAANLNIPAGHISRRKSEISIRMQGEFQNLADLEALEIPLKENRKVRLDQLGWIEDGFKEVRERATFNGESSIGVGLIKRSDANTVQTAADVFKELEKIRTALPPDVKIDIVRDRSQFIKDSVDDVFGNLIIGALLTAVVLFIFLHSLPATVIAAISIPTSVIATFILIDFAGFTLNFMSLMGLAISVGILTANSIVVLENIERYRQMGKSSLEAASIGTKEIALAVTASTLTNVVVFTPMAFMSGITGQFFKQFGLTVTFATLFSLLVSFTLTPMMASRPIKKVIYATLGVLIFLVVWWRLGIDPALLLLMVLAFTALAQGYGWLDKFAQWWDRLDLIWREEYRKILTWALRHKIATLGLVTLLFFGSFALLIFGFIGAEFFPKTDTGTFTVVVEMPIATALGETDAVVTDIARRITRKPYVKSVFASSGKTEYSGQGTGQGVELGMVIVRMVDQEFRPMKTSEFMDLLRPELANIPDAKIRVKEADPMGGGGQSDMQIEIIGRETEQLLGLADSLMSRMHVLGGLINIESSWKIGKPEIRALPHRERVADQGLSIASLGMTLRHLVEGEVASKFRDRGEEHDIRVRLDPAEIASGEEIGALYIKTGDRQVLLSDLAEVGYAEGPSSISHKDKNRIVYVYADIGVGTLGEKVGQLRAYTDQLTLPEGYTIHYGGEAEQMAESFGELLRALLLATILTYMLMAAILESFKHPFTIILTLPLGLIGVLLALFLTNNTISLFSMMAMVMLVGIVVNNGILLLDYTTTLRRQGVPIDEAILQACPVRLRPILMTNLASAIGMLPLALGLGAGGEFRSPLAIVSIGGLVSSTVFTLVVIPVIYRMFEGKKAT